MTTPYDPHGEGRPAQGPQYGPGGQFQPGPYGPAGQQPHGQPPYGPPGQSGAPQPQPGFTYNPYGAPYPAGGPASGDTRPPRPPIMIVGLLMLSLSALPFVVFGVVFLVIPLDVGSLSGQMLADPRLAQAGITAETLLSVLRVGGGVLAAIGVLYVAFAILAFQGRNWARILLTVMTVVFALLLALGLLGGPTGSGSLMIVLGLLVLCLGGTITYYVADSNRFFAAVRRS